MMNAGSQARITWRSDALTAPVALALEPEWTELAEHSLEPNVFAFPWFVIPSLPLLAPLAPLVVTIRKDDRLIGLLMLRPDMGYAKLPVPFLRTALHYGQYLGTPLVRAGDADAFAHGLCGWLDAAPARYGFLKLTLLRDGGAVTDAIAAHCRAQARPIMAINRISRAAIDRSAGHGIAPDDHITASRHKSLRRARQGLTAHGPLAVERLADAQALPAWLDDFLRVEHSGWKGANGSSILSAPVEEGFYRTMAASAFARGQLNLARLTVAGRPIAYTLDVVAARRVYCLKTAFDDAYRRHSPGVLMEYEGLKAYHADPQVDLVDSCTAPDNALLNELWPDRKRIVDLAIARRGLANGALFRLLRRLKRGAGA